MAGLVSEAANSWRIVTDFDVILYGATGFTGALIAERLGEVQHRHELTWAMAGRNGAKLDELQSSLGVDVPTIVADAHDADAIRAMADRARLVIAAAGPYQLHGSGVVAACAAAGTDYIDLAGEPTWIRDMIDEYGDLAAETGARLVFSSGFDSVPSDLGVLLLQERLIELTGSPAARVKGRVLDFRATASGGTVASVLASVAAAANDADVKARASDPFLLTPGFRGVDQPVDRRPVHDDEVPTWAAPFVMAPINTKNVHRTNMLLGHKYGTDFAYDEMVVTGPGDEGLAAAEAMGRSGGVDMRNGFGPGEGPPREVRDAGGFLVEYRSPEVPGVRVTIEGFEDPGYGCTAKMIVEVARTLLDKRDTPGGAWTPATAMGRVLADRLVAEGIVSIEIEG